MISLLGKSHDERYIVESSDFRSETKIQISSSVRPT